MQLKGKDLDQHLKEEALINNTGHGFASQTSGKMNIQSV